MGTILSLVMILSGVIIYLKKMISKKYFQKSKKFQMINFLKSPFLKKKVITLQKFFGKSGDYLTSPNISNLFSEMSVYGLFRSGVQWVNQKILILLNLVQEKEI